MLDTMHKTYTRKDIACTAAALPVPVPAVQTGRHVMAAQSEAASTATSINGFKWIPITPAVAHNLGLASIGKRDCFSEPASAEQAGHESVNDVIRRKR
jgi:hypothetical protein